MNFVIYAIFWGSAAEKYIFIGTVVTKSVKISGLGGAQI